MARLEERAKIIAQTTQQVSAALRAQRTGLQALQLHLPWISFRPHRNVTYVLRQATQTEESQSGLLHCLVMICIRYTHNIRVVCQGCTKECVEVCPVQASLEADCTPWWSPSRGSSCRCCWNCTVSRRTIDLDLRSFVSGNDCRTH